MNSLFVEQQFVQFEKLGTSINLGENIEQWPEMILNAAHSTLPFLSGYQLEVHIQKKVPEQGYGWGYIKVTQPANSSLDRDSVKIPIIVKNKMLSPLDTFISKGNMLPLTESRMAMAMLRPSVLDTASSTEKNDSLTGALTPPDKTLEKGSSLLLSIAHSVDDEQLRFLLPCLSKEAVRLQFKNSGTLDTIQQFVSMAGDQPTLQEKLSSVVDRIVPNVVLVERNDDGYRVKYANTKAFYPREKQLTVAQAANEIGVDTCRQADSLGSVVICKKASLKDNSIHAQSTSENGTWLVKEAGGKTTMGVVFPNLLKMTGESCGLSLFVGEDSFALQDKIAGVKSNDSAYLLSEVLPSGHGFFFKGAMATTPVTVEGTYHDERGETYLVIDPWTSEKLHLTKSAGIKKVAFIGDDHYLVPDDWQFAKLPRRMVKLAESEEQMVKESTADYLTIKHYSNNKYGISGKAVEMVGADHRENIKLADAVWLLRCVGLSQETAVEKLAQANVQHQMNCHGFFHKIDLLNTHWENSQEKVAAFFASAADLCALRPNEPEKLVLAAAELHDATTVDSVLSLNFLNPENLSEFISFIPQLETASARLAQLLVAVRAGLNGPQEGAIERSMQSLERVIEGLKKIRQEINIQ